MEIWKPVKGAEQFYEVSSYGQIRNRKSGEILKVSTTGGYAHIELRYGVNKHCLVHRLVATAFIPNPHHLNVVNHKDENKLNNRADNLEWCTNQYNCTYGIGALARNSMVIQYDMSGNVIKVLESIKEAASELGIKYQGISRCCRNERRSSGGFRWTYINIKLSKAGDTP